MAKLAELITERVDELAHIEALDVGKPLKQGRADAVAMARYMEFYGGAAERWAKRSPIPTATRSTPCASRTG